MPEMFSNASSYEKYMGRWSARLAPLFADFVRNEDGDTVLDVGCGTGSLIEAMAKRNRRSRIVGIDPTPGFIAHARARFADPRITIDEGSAFDLPYPDGSFDCASSLLVFHLIPTPDRAAREMRRVTKPGGTVAACTWDASGGMELHSIFWSEAIGLNPAAESRAERAGSCNVKGQLAQLWEATGLDDVEETSIDLSMDFGSFDDYWLPYLEGVGPAGVYVVGLAEDERDALRDRLRTRLLHGDAEGAFVLAARAWAVRGHVPK